MVESRVVKPDAGGHRSDVGRQVRDALAHLHDLPHLRRHPLVERLRPPTGGGGRPGEALQRCLIEAVESLRPPSGHADDRAARSYRVLSHRYVEGLEIPETCRLLGIAKTEYHRTHGEGLDAVVAYLVEGWRRADATADAAVGRLPAPPSTFVGREREIARVAAALTRARLVTLTGPPGTGKTRLAVEATRRIADRFAGGVVFVALSSISAAELVLPTIARALGLQDATPDQVAAVLRERGALLVLDNFEQVREAAGLVAAVVGACPSLRVLVTSRAPLRLSGEQELPVPPLGLPPPPGGAGGGEGSPDRLGEYEEVRLFVDRARQVDPGFGLTAENAPAVAELCRLLDGLPLAIELAAARTRLLTPSHVLARLRGAEGLALLADGPRDLPARQRTLGTAISWSYDLLAPAEQRLFRRLSVFVGGLGLGSIEPVTGIAPSPGLDALVEHSLVQRVPAAGPEPRFALLEMIREHARAELARAGEEPETARGHADHFLALAEEVGARTFGGRDQAGWMTRIDGDLDNLRAALRCFDARGARDMGRRLAIALAPYWNFRGDVGEGAYWVERFAVGDGARFWELDPPAQFAVAPLLGWRRHGAEHGEAGARVDDEARRALDRARHAGDRAAHARALTARLLIAIPRGDTAVVQVVWAELADVAAELGDAFSLGIALHASATFAGGDRDGDDRRRRITAALDAFRSIDNLWGTAICASALGAVAVVGRDLPRAEACFQEGLDAHRELGDGMGVANARAGLAEVARTRGDLGAARAHMRAGLAEIRSREARSGWGTLRLIIERAARLAVDLGDARSALQLFGAADAHRAGYRSDWSEAEGRINGERLAAARRALAPADADVAYAVGRALSPRETIDVALALAVAGRI